MNDTGVISAPSEVRLRCTCGRCRLALRWPGLTPAGDRELAKWHLALHPSGAWRIRLDQCRCGRGARVLTQTPISRAVHHEIENGRVMTTQTRESRQTLRQVRARGDLDPRDIHKFRERQNVRVVVVDVDSL